MAERFFNDDERRGLRDGELCELRGGDIEDIKGIKKLHVYREQVEDCDAEGRHIGYKPVDHCKTDSGDRYISLKDDLNVLCGDFEPEL